MAGGAVWVGRASLVGVADRAIWVGRASVAGGAIWVGVVGVAGGAIWVGVVGGASVAGRAIWPDSRHVSLMHTGRHTDGPREPIAVGAGVPLAEIRAG